MRSVRKAFQVRGGREGGVEGEEGEGERVVEGEDERVVVGGVVVVVEERRVGKRFEVVVVVVVFMVVVVLGDGRVDGAVRKRRCRWRGFEVGDRAQLGVRSAG